MHIKHWSTPNWSTDIQYRTHTQHTIITNMKKSKGELLHMYITGTITS